MTTVYFVRHCQPDTSGGYNPAFPLTPQGEADAELVAGVLTGKGITAVYSSDYIRAVRTVSGFAESAGLEIRQDTRLRERLTGDRSGSEESYQDFIFRQIDDYSVKAPGGESMAEVQERCMAALKDILAENAGGTVCAALHGMALASLLKHFYPHFSGRDFRQMINLMPMILRLDIDENTLSCGEPAIELAVRRVYPNNYI